MKIRQLLAFLLIVSLFPSVSWARWIWSPEAGKFVNSEGEVQDTAEELYAYALQFYREKDLKETVSQLENVVKKYPSSKVAPDAQYRIGTVYEELGDYLKAFEAYKRLLESYPQNRNYDEVIERLFRIGNAFLSGKKAKLWGLEILPSLPRAVEVFKYIATQAPYSAFGDQSQFQLGLAYKQWGHFQEATETFQTLIDQYPKSQLVPDARFQLAETSFQRSAAQNRDQRALDQASKEVDRFLKRYPDADNSEKAEKLKQFIDEKNAEKNYRIALYYEKDSFLQSAFIYYADAAERYPHTSWGKKAEEKIRSLKEPTAYHTSREKEMQQEIQVLEAKLKVLKDSESADRERIQRKLEVLHKREKNIEKDKKESVTRIQDDLKRREGELKEKFKNLEKKKKQNAQNTSEDFANAMSRWESSLISEREQLEKEKQQLAGWRDDLGVKDQKWGLGALPFMPEPVSDLEKVRGIEAKKLYKLSEERKTLLEDKEVLYKQRSEVLERVRGLDPVGSGIKEEEMGWIEKLETTNEQTRLQKEKILKTQQEITKLENLLDQKQTQYAEKYGQSGWESWLKYPAKVLSGSKEAVAKSIDKSFDLLQPFSGKDLKGQNLQELLERQMHLKEQAANQQNLIQTLTQAFDAQVAMKEQKALMRQLGDAKEADPHQLRKEIKAAQKAIRSRYQGIEDLDREKRALLKELDDLYREREAQQNIVAQTGRKLTSPALKSARMMKAFIFGLPDKGVELTQAVQTIPETDARHEKARHLKEEIELKSLLIEAKSREIVEFKKRLEILQAKASFAGGFKFRSVIVEVPYEFIHEAVDSAKKIVPVKGRRKALKDRLTDETAKLESLKADLKAVEEAIQAKEKSQTPEKTKALEASSPSAAVKQKTAQESAEMKTLKDEIEQVMKDLEVQKGIYGNEVRIFKTQLQESEEKSKDVRKQQKSVIKKAESHQKETGNLRKELREIEGQLEETISRESRLETQETSILEKRMSEIDKMIPGIASKAAAQDLLREREKIESRLSQLALRRDFLSKETERFQPHEAGALPS